MVAEIKAILETVSDPEIPVLSVLDLGVVRNMSKEGDAVTIQLTPTYNGCPAVDAMSMSIKLALLSAGYKTVHIETVLSPAWTSDWISDEGKQKLKAYGIAPPIGKSLYPEDMENLTPPCPQCGSEETTLVSAFGSTACKALFRCISCKEPFDYFKCH
ncbi:MAG: phenylacetate-CoA oxygenase subunit PaaJ [Sphingobacteriia bacterium]|nr:MAG: phenylacetate-CoA oxygenase subunit PaaJ [Sphingobacteriia bacterium]